ncbi:MAG: glutamine--fructose-6-phosphate transaminase (isomerizing) [Clostridia bacterium]|nr:glutamine--fructose-6-phosphate transaminase (isomerizing) [Clostridia bacterium]
MCGIVGYIGDKNATDILLNGLESLEYRGYDSAGISVLSGGHILLCKERGRLSNLREKVAATDISGNIGIGHTRWATHGAPTQINAHPHANKAGDIVVVHNGIIENYEVLREELKNEGYEFISETDTEVVPHLIDYYYNGDLREAVTKTISRLIGSYALCVISSREDGKIVVAREGSPLIIGLGKGENFIASDIPAVLSYTKDFYLLNDGDVAVITENSVDITDKNGAPSPKDIYHVDYSAEDATKGDYEHFMLKEIFEQPAAIKRTLIGRIDENLQIDPVEMNKEFFEKVDRLYIVACGTAYHAGLVGKRAIETLAGIPVEVDLASEFRYRGPLISEKTGVILISQSGETADTLAALRLAHTYGSPVLSITNVVGSSVARESDYVFYTYAGPEIAVASTKAYTTQLVALYLTAVAAAEITKKTPQNLLDFFKKEILSLPEKVTEVLNLNDDVKKLAERIYKELDVYFLGRGLDYSVALEASLKMKEISYIHSDTYASGEIKHGPIALIDDGTVTIAIITDKQISGKTLSNMKEVIARGAFTVGFASPDCEDCEKTFDVYFKLPKSSPLLAPVAAIVPLQLLAYHVSCLKGCDVDKPRNLAKSVTVE